MGAKEEENSNGKVVKEGEVVCVGDLVKGYVKAVNPNIGLFIALNKSTTGL